MKKDIAIIGTGISGLKTAHSLLRNYPDLISSLTFFEAQTHVGGVLNHTFENNFVFEHGAQGVLLSREPFLQTIQELDLKNKLITSKKNKQTRYLIQNKKCIPLSLNIFFLLKHNFLNFSALFHIIKEFFFKKSKKTPLNESVYAFFFRHFGKKIADTFIIPMCFGIWGGAADKILCRYCFPKLQDIEFKNGSILSHFIFSAGKKKKTSLQGLGSFAEGMRTLPKSLFMDIEKLCNQFHIPLHTHFNTPIFKIHAHENELKRNCITINEENKIFDIVIYAGQPWREQNISFGTTLHHQEALKILKKIPTHSIAVVGIGGEKSPNFLYKDGFGALENNSSQDLLGIIFIHSTYNEHVPVNNFLYRILLGGEVYPSINNHTDAELLERSHNHLKSLQLCKGDEKITFKKVIRWERYIPLSTEYQDKVLCAIWQLEALNPGLFFTGNYIKGVSVADCLDQANITATKVANFILEQS